MRLSLAHVGSLGVKELRSLRADPVLPILILYMFTFAVFAMATGAKLDIEHARVAIVDEDRSLLSRRITDAIQEPYFHTPVGIGASSIDREMDAGRFPFVIEIPAGLEADLLAGRPTSIQINVDATAMSLAGNGAVYLQNIVRRELLRFARGTEESERLPVELVVHTRFNPNSEAIWFSSGMQVINNITMLSIILVGAALVREREQGTIEHLLVMPVTPAEIMLAKVWANGLVILLGALLSLLLVVRLVLGVPLQGSIPLLLLGMAAYEFSVASLGILIATIARTMPQLGLLAIPVIMTMVMLSGSMTALESMPRWLQMIMQLSPSTHFVAFAQSVLYRGAGIEIVWPQLALLVVIGGVLFLVALSRFRRTIEAAQ